MKYYQLPPPPPPPPPPEKPPLLEKPLEKPFEDVVGVADDLKLERDLPKLLAKITLLNAVISLPSYQSGGFISISLNLSAHIFSTPNTTA